MSLACHMPRPSKPPEGYHDQGCTNSVARSPWRRNFVWLRLVLVDPQYVHCFTPPFWGLKFWGGPQDFLNICPSPIMIIFWRRDQLMQFLTFAFNNKFTTNTCSCSSKRLHVQESVRAFINENPKSAPFLEGKYKIQKVTQLLLQKKYRYS